MKSQKDSSENPTDQSKEDSIAEDLNLKIKLINSNVEQVVFENKTNGLVLLEENSKVSKIFNGTFKSDFEKSNQAGMAWRTSKHTRQYSLAIALKVI